MPSKELNTPYIALEGEPNGEKPKTPSYLFYAADDQQNGPKLISHDITESPKKDPESSTRKGKKMFRKLSLMYGGDEYEEEVLASQNAARVEQLGYAEKIARQEALNRDVANSKKESPDAPQDPSKKGPKSRMTTEARSLVSNRLYPKPNTDVMRANNATKFLFTKMTPEMMMHLWDLFTRLFFAQCTWVVLYAAALRFLPAYFWPVTIVFAVIMMEFSIQNVYCLHDVAHGASFPPHEWQKYITHCWADFVSISWEDLILQHNRHHAATPDLLIHGEFGWDPEEWLYVLQDKSWFLCPLVPLWHFVGASDTGVLFAIMWYSVFPEDGPGGKRNAQACTKWFPMRVKHQAFLCALWGSVWLLGVVAGWSLNDGWKFMLIVNACSRGGFSLAWTVFTNFNHSHLWNDFLSSAPERNYPIIAAVASFLLGGPERFNEMLFHDLHHAFPNGVGALSQRGRFYGWEKVHDAAMAALDLGIYVQDETSPTPKMTKNQRKRSMNFVK